MFMLSSAHRRRTGASNLRRDARPYGRTVFALEPLEPRRLFDATGPLPSLETDRILITYRDGPSAVTHSVSLPQTQPIDLALAAHRSDPSILFAEPDYRVQAAVMTNDPYFGYMWSLDNTGQWIGKADADVDAPEAWNISRGNTRTVVAVIDTGIDYTHPDLYQNIWINQGEIPQSVRSSLTDTDGDSLFTFRDLNDPRNLGPGKIADVDGNGRIDGRDLLYSVNVGGWADGVSNDGDGYVDDLIGWNFVNQTNNPYDDHSHGTHVAGTIGASANNGIGITGLAWDVQLAALKFLDARGSGYISAALAALQYAISKGIPVSNNSWGGGGYSQAFFQTLQYARARGHIFVAAAGNGGADGVGDNNDRFPSYPANYNLDNVVSVAATDAADRLARFSNFGRKTVDIAAPGVDILSTVPGGYAFYSGTSMATPHVTGAIALVRSSHPEWSHSQIISQVLNKSDKLAQLTRWIASGGRLNAHRPLSTALVGTTAPYIVSATPNSSQDGSIYAVRVEFSKAIDPSTFTVQDVVQFRGPRGTIEPAGVVSVAASGSRQFDVLFDTQSAPGDYRMEIGADVRDTSGNRLDQDRDEWVGEPDDDHYAADFTLSSRRTFAATPGTWIRDRRAAIVSILVDRDITIADLDVKLDIAHTADRDMEIRLIGPDGARVRLIGWRGGMADDLRGTVFDDEADVSIASGRAPFAGSYRPEDSLTAWDGQNARGVWRLRVYDRARGNTGRIRSWSLMFDESLGSESMGTGTPIVSPVNGPALQALLAEAAERPLPAQGQQPGGVARQPDRADTRPASHYREVSQESGHAAIGQGNAAALVLSAAVQEHLDDALVTAVTRQRWEREVDELMHRSDADDAGGLLVTFDSV